ncbi:MAG: hypothetical protein RMK29_19375, partial [Myxococcales bacterium]|nr:hypothetical protein [Myxococcales bacterium]
MSRQQHHPAELVFSVQELAELGARLASGTPSQEEETLVLPRPRPSPFDRLVEAAFAAEESRRRSSTPPRPSCSTPLPPSSSGSPPPRLQQTEPIASSPPPPRFRPHPGPPRPVSPALEVEGAVDLRATQPDLPALGADDSPFAVESEAANVSPAQRAASVAALAAAVVGRPAERPDLPTIAEIMSSSPPPTAGGAKVAVAVEAGGSMPSAQISAIEALSRAVQELLPPQPEAPSARTPALLSLDDAELDMIEEEEAPSQVLPGSAAVGVESPPLEQLPLPPLPPPLPDAPERTPPQAQPAAVEALEPPATLPLPWPGEGTAPGPPELESSEAIGVPPASGWTSPSGAVLESPVAPHGGPLEVEPAAAAPPALDAELEMLRSLAAAEEGVEELEVVPSPAVSLETAAPGAMDVVPVPPASACSTEEIEVLVPGPEETLVPAASEVPVAEALPRTPPPPPRRRTPPLGLPTQPPGVGGAAPEPPTAPLPPESRALVDAPEAPVHLPPPIESR